MKYTRDLFCTYRECPYKELDRYKSYEDYMKECDVYGKEFTQCWEKVN